MTEPTTVLVFDTGPLSHFTQEGWLGILRHILGDRRAVIPDTVVAELRTGAVGRPHLNLVLEASWIEQHELLSDEELSEFAHFSSLLVVRERNRGEAGVLAYAKANRATAIIDDGPGRKAAQTYEVRCQGTLALLCEGIRGGHLTIGIVSSVADHLIEGEYRLPFGPGGFEKWARENGLILVEDEV